MSEQNGYHRNGNDVLSDLHQTLSEMHHDLNNPLAIISGNVQYLLEVARASGYDEHLFEPLHDIEEASKQITDSLDELKQIKQNIPTVNGSPQTNGSVRHDS